MAAPVKREVVAPVTGLSASTTSATQAGDLVVVITGEGVQAGIPTHTLEDGYTEIRTTGLDDGSTDARLSIAYKLAAGGVESFQAYTSDGAGTTPLTCLFVYQAGTFDVSTLPISAQVTNVSTAAPNPPAVSGLTGDFDVMSAALWLLSASATVTVTQPASYTLETHVAGSAINELGIATRNVLGAVGSTEDPATWADNTGLVTGTISITIAFKGASASAAHIPPRRAQLVETKLEPLATRPRFLPFPYFQASALVNPVIAIRRAQLFGEARVSPTLQPKLPFPFWQAPAPPTASPVLPMRVVRVVELERKPTRGGFSPFPFYARTPALIPIVQAPRTREALRDIVRGGFSPFPFVSTEPPPPANPLVPFTSVRIATVQARHVAAAFSPFPFSPPAPSQSQHVPFVRAQLVHRERAFVQPQPIAFPFFQQPAVEQVQLVPMRIVQLPRAAALFVARVVLSPPNFYFVVEPAGEPTGQASASYAPSPVALATVTPIAAECSVSVVPTPTATK